MTYVEWYQAIKMMPQARKHIIEVNTLLTQQSYQEAINSPYNGGSQHSMHSIVKSYFWACRLIKNCQCLPRSIALFQQLKASGYEVNHCFGVNKNSNQLAAHAWVEHQDKPLNEHPSIKKRFNQLKSQHNHNDE